MAASCSQTMCKCQEHAMEDYILYKMSAKRAFIALVKWYNSVGADGLNMTPIQKEAMRSLHGEWKGGLVRMKDYVKMHNRLDPVFKDVAEWKTYLEEYEGMMHAFKGGSLM